MSIAGVITLRDLVHIFTVQTRDVSYVAVPLLMGVVEFLNGTTLSSQNDTFELQARLQYIKYIRGQSSVAYLVVGISSSTQAKSIFPYSVPTMPGGQNTVLSPTSIHVARNTACRQLTNAITEGAMKEHT